MFYLTKMIGKTDQNGRSAVDYSILGQRLLDRTRVSLTGRYYKQRVLDTYSSHLVCTFTGGVMLDSDSSNHWYCWEMGVETLAQIGTSF